MDNNHRKNLSFNPTYAQMINSQHLEIKFLQVFRFLIPREFCGGQLCFCCNFFITSPQEVIATVLDRYEGRH